MRKALRTLIICSLLIAGAASPAVAAESHQSSAHGIHINGTSDGHTP